MNEWAAVGWSLAPVPLAAALFFVLFAVNLRRERQSVARDEGAE